MKKKFQTVVRKTRFFLHTRTKKVQIITTITGGRVVRAGMLELVVAGDQRLVSRGQLLVQGRVGGEVLQASDRLSAGARHLLIG